MRTKALLVAAVLGLAAIANSLAQVYSVNAVGYVNKDFQPGFTLFANPLDATMSGGNNLTNLMKDLAIPATEAVNFYQWTGTSFKIATYLGLLAAWDDSTIVINPGDGGFINTTVAFTNTFVGEVKQGTLQNPIPAGFSIKASMVPQAGNVDVLGLTTLGAGDNLYIWNRGLGRYEIYTFLAAPNVWDPVVPVLGVAEGCFINAAAATSWNRTFSVNTP